MGKTKFLIYLKTTDIHFMNNLKDFPPVYYINLDKDIDRNNWMLNQFSSLGIKEFTRISGISETNTLFKNIILGAYPNYATSGEIGCTLSHLKTIKFWYETSTTKYAIVCEDDLDLFLSNYWNFTWNDFFKSVPNDADIVQLSIISAPPEQINMNLHLRQRGDYSTACYLITRKYAGNLIQLHCKNDKYI